MDEFRIGDAERERVREMLQRHAAEGRLTLDELSDRLGEVYAARTAADLDRALRQLPPLPRTERQARRRPMPHVPIVALVVGVWAVVAVTNGAWFFFPFLPLLLFGLLASRGVACSPGWPPYRSETR
jgi:Domain of unknown function (DUF1707)